MLTLETALKLTCKRKENPDYKINYIKRPVGNLRAGGYFAEAECWLRIYL